MTLSHVGKCWSFPNNVPGNSYIYTLVHTHIRSVDKRSVDKYAYANTQQREEAAQLDNSICSDRFTQFASSFLHLHIFHHNKTSHLRLFSVKVITAHDAHDNVELYVLLCKNHRQGRPTIENIQIRERVSFVACKCQSKLSDFYVMWTYVLYLMARRDWVMYRIFIRIFTSIYKYLSYTKFILFLKNSFFHGKNLRFKKDQILYFQKLISLKMMKFYINVNSIFFILSLLEIIIKFNITK